MIQNLKPPCVLEDEIIERQLLSNSSSMDTRVLTKSIAKNVVKKDEPIDYSKISLKGYSKVIQISNHPEKYKNYITDIDKKIYIAYIDFVFGKIDVEEYVKVCADFIRSLDINPTNDGVENFFQRIDKKIKNVMYNLFHDFSSALPSVSFAQKFYEGLYKEIKNILDENNIVKVKSEIEPWRDTSVLYVYKKTTRCHINKHLIVATNAYFTGRNNTEIKLNVEYCVQCKKFLMSYAKYESL